MYLQVVSGCADHEGKEPSSTSVSALLIVQARNTCMYVSAASSLLVETCMSVAERKPPGAEDRKRWCC